MNPDADKSICMKVLNTLQILLHHAFPLLITTG